MSLTRRLAMIGVALAVLFTILLVTGCKSPVDPKPKAYDVTIRPTTDGVITSNPTKAAEGKPVTVTVTPNEGKALDKLEIDAKTDLHAVDTEVLHKEDGSSDYTFKMPSGGVIVTATFIDTYIFGITISAEIRNGKVISKLQQQYSGYAVNLKFVPDTGFLYHPGSLRITTLLEDEEDNYTIEYEEVSPTEATFIMPQAPVLVYATFFDENTPLYDITISPPAHGKINSIHHAAEGDKVFVDLEPNSGYRYKNGSIAAEGITFDEESTSNGLNGSRRFSFTMPANAVTLSAEFELVPTHDVTLTKAGFGIMATFTGVPLAGGKAGEGDRITLYLDIDNLNDYRYKPDSFTISDNVTDLVERVPGHEWTFTMPAGAVSASVEIIEVDKSKPLNNVTHGVLNGGEITFFNLIDGQARQDDIVSFEVQANAGQIISGNPTSSPNVIFTKIEESSGTKASDTTGRWYFTMPDKAIVVTITFAKDSSTYKVTASPDLQNGGLSFTGLNAQKEAVVGAYVYVIASGSAGYIPEGTPYADPPVDFEIYGQGFSWRFKMPKSDVVLGMDFRKITFKVQEGVVEYGGSISFGGAYTPGTGEAQRGLPVEIYVTPIAGYKTQGVPALNVTGVTVTGSNTTNDPWKFTMPEQDVKVSMSFELATFNLAIAGNIQYGTLSIISGGPATAKMGDTIRIYAQPNEQYEIASNTPSATVNPSGAGTVSLSSIATGTWEFTMPAGNVTLGMTFSRINYNIVARSVAGNGTIQIKNEQGAIINKAPKDATITITAIPGFGVGADTPDVVWTEGQQEKSEEAVKIFKNNWTFTMKGANVSIDIVFNASFLSTGNVKIYSNGEFQHDDIDPVLKAEHMRNNGAPNALSAANIQLGNISHDFDVTTALNLQGQPVPRHNNHTQAIRLKTNAVTTRTDIGFRLTRKTIATPIDLDGTSGLSFWLYYPFTSGSQNYAIMYIGLGDVGINNRKGYRSSGNNNDSYYYVSQQAGWYQVIIPVPKISNDFQVEETVFSIQARIADNEYFLIDDIEFLEGDALELQGIQILSAPLPASSLSIGVPVNAVSLVTDTGNTPKNIRFTYVATDPSIQPVICPVFSVGAYEDKSKFFDPWGLADDYEFEVSGNATLSGNGGNTMVTPTGGSFQLRLKIGSIPPSNWMTVTVP